MYFPKIVEEQTKIFLGDYNTYNVLGFAKYLSILGANLVDSENLPWARFIVEEMFTAMQADSDTNQHWALSDPVSSR